MSKFRLPKILFVFVICGLLAACGIFTSGKRGKDYYVVNGTTYRLLRSGKGYKKTGMASFYADRFHGRKTASGEIFNKKAMTCAHTTLPMGTLLRVTNLENRKSVIVRVNDRGPFKRNRLVDLSPAAAQKLDFITRGTVRVRVEYVGQQKKKR